MKKICNIAMKKFVKNEIDLKTQHKNIPAAALNVVKQWCKAGGLTQSVN